MRIVAAIAFAVMFFTVPAHSAGSAVSYETIAESADSVALFDGRCAVWRSQVVCAF